MRRTFGSRCVAAVGPTVRNLALALATLVFVGLGGAACIGDIDYDLCTADNPPAECEGTDSSTLQGQSTGTGGSGGTSGGDNQNPGSGTTGTGGDSGDGGSGDGSTTTTPPVCNPNGEPTWSTPVSSIMSSRCVRCHRRQCSTYTGITPWVNNGSLEDMMSAGHYISGSDKTKVLRWLTVGAPETDCDVP